MNAGVTLIVLGTTLTLVYYFLNTTYVGPIAELAGVGFMFFFLGALTVLGEALGATPSDEGS